MINIIKGNEPDFFTDFKRRYTPSNWNDYQQIQERQRINIKEQLKDHMLLEEQDLFCGYCERPIDTCTSHIEHIRAKSKYPHLFQDYNNLMVSCMSKVSCGNYKDGKGKIAFPDYYEKFINPVMKNPKDYFTYDLKTGEVILKGNITIDMMEKGCITIGVLNLNEKSLVSARKTYLIKLSSCIDYPETIVYFNEFPTLVDFFKTEFKITSI